MDCKNAQTLLGGYLDRELDAVRTLEIEDHLHGCAVCSQSYKDHQVLSEGLRTGSVYLKAPPIFRSASSARCAKRQSRVGPRWLSWSWVGWLPWRQRRLFYLPWFRFCAAHPRRKF
jgi:predicted anti-sigma-YlaC factor YlaD